MSDGSEFTEEDKKRMHRELVDFLNNHIRDGEEAAQKQLKIFEEWHEVRNNTIQIVGNAAEQIKSMNNEVNPYQVLCKTGSIAGKAATFFGPAGAIIGATTSVACDSIYAVCSKSKIDKLEKLSGEVLKAIDKDNEVTAQLFDAMNKTRQINETMRNCVKKFHGGTVTGFFDNVPSLKNFVRTVKGIRTVENLEGLEKFLFALREEAEHLAGDPDLFPSLVWLLTYNPDILNISVTMSEIAVNLGILSVGAHSAGLAGCITRGLNVLGMVADVYDIVNKICNYDTYPKMAEELLKIKKELQKGKAKMQEIKEESDKGIGKRTSQ